MRFVVVIVLLLIAGLANAKPFTITQEHCDDMVQGVERFTQLKAAHEPLDAAWRSVLEPLKLGEPDTTRWDTLPTLNLIAAEMFSEQATVTGPEYVERIKTTCPTTIGQLNK